MGKHLGKREIKKEARREVLHALYAAIDNIRCSGNFEHCESDRTGEENGRLDAMLIEEIQKIGDSLARRWEILGWIPEFERR